MSVMSRNMPVRRHSFANLEKANQASAGAEGSGKKKGGRFKRWRKVSFSFGDTVHNVTHDRKQSISRSLSAGDRPVGVPVKVANVTGQQIQENHESDSGEQGIGSSAQNPDNSQVKRYIMALS